MANTQLTADGLSVSLWWALPNYAVDPWNPTVAELDAALRIDCEVSWSDFGFGTQPSNQISDPYLCDVGNTQTRGLAQFGGTISFAYPSQYEDLTDSTAATFAALSQPGTDGYLIMRVDGLKPSTDEGANNNDFISVFRAMSDGYSDNVTGADLGSFKYTITFIPRGEIYVNTIVGPATVATPAPIGATDYTVGGKTPLGVHYTGRELASVPGEWDGYPGAFEWRSSDSTVATVDANGVVHGISTGTAEITATSKNTKEISASLSVSIA